MKEIIDFLYANPAGCLATVDEQGKPHIRPMGFMLEQGGKLWFCTSNTKDVFYQLQCNPAVEFCATSKDFVTVRLSGDVIFSVDLEIKRKMLETNLLVKSTFKTADNPEFEIFYIKNGHASMYELAGETLKTNIVF